MIKPYLLIAGYNYYPEQGTGDWIGCYKTEEEAKKYWDELKMGPATLEWYEIVDLRDWVDWRGRMMKKGTLNIVMTGTGGRSILTQQSNLKCWCQECCKKETGHYNATRVVVCPDCGNKRCPRATNHELECSGSNKPGQEGSIY